MRILGGGLIKQRVARPPRGKSKGWRVILAFRKSEVTLFSVRLSQEFQGESQRGRIESLQAAAKELLELSGKQLDKLVEQGTHDRGAQ